MPSALQDVLAAAVLPVLLLAMARVCPAADAQVQTPGPQPASARAALLPLLPLPPLPPLTLSVDGIRLIEDDRQLPPALLRTFGGNAAFARRAMDPWGTWQSGLHLRLSVAAPAGWAIVRADQATGTARMDRGEVLEGVTGADSNNAGLSFETQSEDDIWPRTRWEFPRTSIGLNFPLPTRRCGGIASMQVGIRVIMAELGQIKLVHLTSKANQAQALPDGGLTITISEEGKVTATFPGGALAHYHAVRFLAADGTALVPNSTSVQSGVNITTETFGCPERVAAVDIDCYGPMRCATVACVFTDLAFTANDPSLLTRDSATPQEIAVPPLETAAAAPAPPARQAAPARKLAPKPANSSL